jgi:hypothetical protein
MGRLAIAASCLWPAVALGQERSNVTDTTLEIYAVVGLTLVIGFAWVLYKTRGERKKNRESGSAV